MLAGMDEDLGDWLLVIGEELEEIFLLCSSMARDTGAALINWGRAPTMVTIFNIILWII